MAQRRGSLPLQLFIHRQRAPPPQATPFANTHTHIIEIDREGGGPYFSTQLHSDKARKGVCVWGWRCAAWRFPLSSFYSPLDPRSDAATHTSLPPSLPHSARRARSFVATSAPPRAQARRRRGRQKKREATIARHTPFPPKTPPANQNT